MDSIDEFNTLDLKCGEVYLCKKGSLILVCALCETQFKDFQEYTDHVMEKHFLFDVLVDVEDVKLEKPGKVKQQTQLSLNVKDEDGNFEFIEGIAFLDKFDGKRFEETPLNSMETEISINQTNCERINRKRRDELIAMEVKEFIYNCSSDPRKPEKTRYKCRHCDKGFYSKSGFRLHIRSHNTQYQCERVDCGKTFFNSYSFRRHMKYCPDDFEEPCPECGIIFNDKDLFKKHKRMQTHPYNCNTCKNHKDFRSHFEYAHFSVLKGNMLHLADVPLLEEEPIETENLTSINSKVDDPLHLKQAQPSNIISTKNYNQHEDRTANFAIKSIENKTSLLPGIIPTNDESELKNLEGHDKNCLQTIIHLNTGSDSESKIDWDTPFRPDNLRNRKKRPYKPRNKLFFCTYCKRNFRRRSQFDTHLRIHTGEKPHQCEICGRQFRAVTTLQRHLSTHKKLCFICSYCDKSFSHKVALLSHETWHTQERNESCDKCEKHFYTLNQLNTHKRRVHKESNDVLPFACDLCSNRYRTASMLSTHKLRKHYKTAKFQCEKCHKKFTEILKLEEHEKIHTDSIISNSYVNLKKE